MINIPPIHELTFIFPVTGQIRSNAASHVVLASLDDGQAAGRAHAAEGVEATEQGSCVVKCPACQGLL